MSLPEFKTMLAEALRRIEGRLLPQRAEEGQVLVHGKVRPAWGDTPLPPDGSITLDMLAAAVAAKLSPITTQGDVIVGGAAGATSRLAIGASAKVLTSDGTTANWEELPVASASQRGVVKGGEVPGLTTGAVVGSGYVGQIVEAVSTTIFSQATPVVGTYYTDSTLSLPLGAGNWLVFWKAAPQTTNAGSGGVYHTSRLKDSGGTIYDAGVSLAAKDPAGDQVSAIFGMRPIVLTSSKTLQIELKWNVNITTPSVSALYNRNDLGRGYITAVRIA